MIGETTPCAETLAGAVEMALRLARSTNSSDAVLKEAARLVADCIRITARDDAAQSEPRFANADLSMREDHVADRALRLECAKLADGRISDAREIYEFVMGSADLTPIQKLRAAVSELEGTA